MRRTLARTTLLATIVTVSLAACGGDDDGSGSGSGSEDGGASTEGALTVVAEDSLDFDQDSYTAQAGEVSFVYENGGSLPHTLVIEDIDTDTFKLSVGDTDEGSVELEPGEYVLYCDIPGHRGGGMEATLTVE